MKTTLLLFIALLMNTYSNAQCEPVATINEDFSTFEILTEAAFPQQCWTNKGTHLDTAEIGTPPNKYVLFDNQMLQVASSFLLTPELIEINSEYELSFDVFKVPSFNGTFSPHQLTVTVGTYDTNASTGVFTPFGNPIIVTNNSVTHTVNLTVDATQKFIAFLITGNATHMLAGIDNIKYGMPIAAINSPEKASFSISPNPATGKNITISHNLQSRGTINIYALTGAKIYTADLNETGIQDLNLADFSAGMYIVKIDSGNYSESKKLILQ